MPRSINIPRRDVGGGAAVVLPSVEAAAAPARAAGEIGRALAGGVARVAGTVQQAAEERQRKADALTLVREGTEFSTKIGAALATAKQELEDWALSPDFDPSQVSSRYQELYGRAFQSVGTPTHPQVAAALEGRRAGVLGADMGATVRELEKLRAGQAIEATVAAAAERLPRARLEFLPLHAQAAEEAFAAILEQDPGRAKEVLAAKRRVMGSIEDTYSAQGFQGQIRYFTDVWDGRFDGLDPERAAAARALSRTEIPQILGDMEEEVLLDADYGEPVENGGLFPTFDGAPQNMDLRALRGDLEALPDGMREPAMAAVDRMIDQRARRQSVMKTAIEPLFENGQPVPHLAQDPEAQAALASYWQRFVAPHLDSPTVPVAEKTAIIARLINGVGYLPAPAATWAQGVIDNAMIGAPGAAETVVAIAAATRAAGQNALLVERARTGRPELALMRAGLLGPDKTDFGTDREAFLDRVARFSNASPARAVDDARRDIELARAGRSSGQARATDPGLGMLQGVLAPGSVLPELANRQESMADQVQDVTEGLRERAQLLGEPVGEISRDQLADIQARAEAAYQRLGGQLPEGAAQEMAVDEALRLWLKDEPAVNYGGRVHRSKALKEALQGNPDELVDLEIDDFFRSVDVDPARGDRTVTLIQPPGAGLNPNEFLVAVEGTGDQPSRVYERHLTIDPNRSVYQRVLDERRMGAVVGEGPVDERVGGEARAGGQALPFELVTMDRQGFRQHLSPWMSGRPQGEITQDEVDLAMRRYAGGDAIAAAFERADGGPLYKNSETLTKLWDSTYAAGRKAAAAPKPVGKIGPFRIFGRVPYGEESNIHLFAKRQADARVIERMRLEFENKNPDVFLRFLRTGKLPSEADQDEPSTRVLDKPIGSLPPPSPQIMASANAFYQQAGEKPPSEKKIGKIEQMKRLLDIVFNPSVGPNRETGQESVNPTRQRQRSGSSWMYDNIIGGNAEAITSGFKTLERGGPWNFSMNKLHQEVLEARLLERAAKFDREFEGLTGNEDVDYILHAKDRITFQKRLNAAIVARMNIGRDNPDSDLDLGMVQALARFTYLGDEDDDSVVQRLDREIQKLPTIDAAFLANLMALRKR